MFAQSYNICTDKYVKSDAGAVGAEEAFAGLEEYEVSMSVKNVVIFVLESLFE